MPTYVTDYREHTTGAQPSGTTEAFNPTAGAFAVVEDAAAIGGKWLEFTPSVAQRVGLLSTDAGTAAAMEVSCLLILASPFGLASWGGVTLGAGDTNTAYRAELHPNDGKLYIYRGGTAVGNVAVGAVYDTRMGLRLRADATEIKAKAWIGGRLDEPGAWTLSGAYVVGTGGRPTGYAGVFFEGTPDFTNGYVDVLGIATAGETAPLVIPPRWAVEVTLFGDDDETPILGTVDGGGAVTEASFSTDPLHPRPYLDMPRAFPEQAVDFQQGRATIGQTKVTLLDKRRTPSDQDSGLITFHLPTADGESALNGRRLLMEETDGTTRRTLLDGVVIQPDDNADHVSYDLDARDTLEHGRTIRLFDRTGTCSISPRGVVTGYGLRADGSWLQPATVPHTGTYVDRGFQLGGFNMAAVANRDRVPVDRVVTAKMRAAVTLGVRDNFGVGDVLLVLNNVELWWRNVGDTPWNEAIIQPDYTATGALFNTARGKCRPATGPEIEVDYLLGLLWGWPLGATTPVHGAAVEMMLVWVGPASKDWPFHFEGTHGELRRNVYRGDYSTRQNAAGAVVPYVPRTRYNEAALLADETPCRLRIKEPAAEAKAWLEKLDVATGSAPALDATGAVSPVRYELPAPDVVLGDLNDDNTRGGAWSHPSGDAVNYVRVSYQRDYAVPADRDPLGERSDGDGIASRDISVEAGNDASIETLNLRVWEIKTISLRAVGGAEGQPLTGDVRDETGYQVARLRHRQALDRLLYGGQRVKGLEVLRSAHPDLRVGVWYTLSLGRIPDYRDGTRGTYRLVQVVRSEPLDFHWWSVDVLDAGAVNAPLVDSTVGAITSDDAGVVTVPIATVPAGAEARVDYAVAALEPDAGSGLWTYAGRAAAADDVLTPPLPAGADFWIRHRSERSGYRPSAWTVEASDATPSTPRVKDVAATVGDDGAVVLTWTPNAFAAGVRVDYGVHAPGTTAVLAWTEEFDAAAGTATLANPLPASYTLTADVTAFPGWTGSAVSGAAGETVRVVQADTRPLSWPWVLTASATYTAPATVLALAATFTPATQWFGVYAKRDGWPTVTGVAPSAGGVPDAAFLRGGRRKIEAGVAPVMPAVSVSNGTWYVVILAEGQDTTSHTWEDSVVVAGVPGDGTDGGAITAVPGLASIEKAVAGGGAQDVLLSFTPTAELKTRVRWKANGVVVQTDNLAVGVAGATRSYAVTSPVTIAEVELRHTNSAGTVEGPPAYAGPLRVDGSV